MGYSISQFFVDDNSLHHCSDTSQYSKSRTFLIFITTLILTPLKSSFKIALKYFKYAAILFLTSYSIYIVYDDYIFIKKITDFAGFGQFIGLELMWLLVYFLGFSFYYWLTTCVVIFIYHKLYKRIKNDSEKKQTSR